MRKIKKYKAQKAQNEIYLFFVFLSSFIFRHAYIYVCMYIYVRIHLYVNLLFYFDAPLFAPIRAAFICCSRQLLTI